MNQDGLDSLRAEIASLRLQELTGHESGAVVYAESERGCQETWVGNWSAYEGLPRAFVTGTFGLGEELGASVPCGVPQVAVAAMVGHELEVNDTRWTPDVNRMRAWYLPVHDVTVVTSDDWA